MLLSITNYNIKN